MGKDQQVQEGCLPVSARNNKAIFIWGVVPPAGYILPHFPLLLSKIQSSEGVAEDN